MRSTALVLPLLLFGAAACAATGEFSRPQAVTIRGYDGDAMEPFVTGDGRYLIFNNSNQVPAETDLQIAERIDDVTFEYRGRLDGANSPDLDAVASVDAGGTIYFISTRNYQQTATTVYRGRFDNGVVTAVAPVAGLRSLPGHLDFDVAVSSDGSTLYLSDGLFIGGAVPAAADLAVAVRAADGSFVRSDDGQFQAVNTKALEYAAAVSDDGLELFFTRVVNGTPAIYRTTRASRSLPWDMPARIASIPGFAEAPALAPGGQALYYHARRANHFVIERVVRQPARRRAVRH